MINELTPLIDKKIDGRSGRDFTLKPNVNTKTFKYRVFYQSVSTLGEDIELSKRFKNINDITNEYDIKKSSIYLLIHNKQMKKYKHLRIEKIDEPASNIIYFD